MNYAYEDRVLALAGIFQAAWLTDQTAWQGREDETERDAALGSLFQFNAPDVPGIFGGTHNLRSGLEIVARVMSKDACQEDLRLTQYVIGLLNHARRVRKDSAMAETLRTGLERAAQQKSHFDSWDEHVLASLADVYSNTIGKLEPRIMVRGEPARLQNPRNVKMIRSLLLAGIRAAVLWEQTGGSRWQLLFKRRKLSETAKGLAAAL